MIFGEVIPQAYCTGPSQIFIATAMLPIVKTLMFFCWPICFPISKALDKVLGLHGKKRYYKKDLKALIELHQFEEVDKKDAIHGEETIGALTKEEIKIITSTIDLRDIRVDDPKIMVSKENMFMLSDSDIISTSLLEKIKEKNFTRLPLYHNHDKNTIVGVVGVKSMLGIIKDAGKALKDVKITKLRPVYVRRDTNLLEMLALFQENKCSLVMVSDKEKAPHVTVCEKKGGHKVAPPSRRDALVHSNNKESSVVGLVHIKDVFEQILQAELLDEDQEHP